jgi:hypothetical protein
MHEGGYINYAVSQKAPKIVGQECLKKQQFGQGSEM